jgi:hypothetical protein
MEIRHAAEVCSGSKPGVPSAPPTSVDCGRSPSVSGPHRRVLCNLPGRHSVGDSQAYPHRSKRACSTRHVNMTISLGFLAPKLIQAAVEGRLRHGVGVAQRRRPARPESRSQPPQRSGRVLGQPELRSSWEVGLLKTYTDIVPSPLSPHEAGVIRPATQRHTEAALLLFVNEGARFVLLGCLVITPFFGEGASPHPPHLPPSPTVSRNCWG